MLQFVLSISEITPEQYEKVIAIQVKSRDKVRFVPQNSNNLGISTPAFTAVTQTFNRNGRMEQEVKYTGGRFEWAEDGALYAKEIFELFIPASQAQVQKAG